MSFFKYLFFLDLPLEQKQRVSRPDCKYLPGNRNGWETGGQKQLEGKTFFCKLKQKTFQF